MCVEGESYGAEAMRLASGIVALEQHPEIFDALREEARRLLQQMAARRVAAEIAASTGEQ